MSRSKIRIIATDIMARLRTRSTAATSDVIDIPEAAEPLSGVSAPEIREEAISKRAYQLWLERGCPEGSPEEDWLKAESELRRPEARASGGATDDV